MDLFLIRLAILVVMIAPIVVLAASDRSGSRLGWLDSERRRVLLAALVVVGVVHAAWHLSWAVVPDGGHDAIAYWSVDLGQLYSGVYGSTGYFPYSPAAALLASPLGSMPWPAFLVLWYAFNLAVASWLTGRQLPIWLAFPPLAWLITIGNIEILLGAVVVLGFRWPWVWSFAVLTKVTPAIGLLWFAVRREWGALAQALGATLLIVVTTWLILPEQWAKWLSLLGSESPDGWLSLWIRLPIAASLVVWGALTDRRWTVLVATLLSVPHFWFATLGGLVALAALGYRWTGLPDARRSDGTHSSSVQSERVVCQGS